MNKATICQLVEAQPDEVNIEELIEQLCLLRQLDVAEEEASQSDEAQERLAEASAAAMHN